MGLIVEVRYLLVIRTMVLHRIEYPVHRHRVPSPQESLARSADVPREAERRREVEKVGTVQAVPQIAWIQVRGPQGTICQLFVYCRAPPDREVQALRSVAAVHHP